MSTVRTAAVKARAARLNQPEMVQNYLARSQQTTDTTVTLSDEDHAALNAMWRESRKPRQSLKAKSPNLKSNHIFKNRGILSQLYPELAETLQESKSLIKKAKCSKCAKNKIAHDILTKMLHLPKEGRDFSKLDDMSPKFDPKIVGLIKGEIPLKDAFPTLTESAGHFTRSLGKAIKKAATEGKVVAPKSVRESRINICAECEFCLAWRCTKCGCFLKSKVHLASEHCDIGKW